jgi:NADPH-dependent 7-cyano-7-deazaguanine reductase QueF-like protein
METALCISAISSEFSLFEIIPSTPGYVTISTLMLDHHPIITINWKSVKLSLKSFDMDAITKRDIALATEIEKKLKGNNKSEP